MRVPLYQVDAFTEVPFRGNPAAVCLLDGARDEAWMRAVAAEMNLSETAFLHPQSGSTQGAWSLRWFTPVCEVALCGHATLAAAHVLWETERLPRERVAEFDTQSGRLTATARDGEIELDFPAKRVESSAAPAGLAAALGVETRAVLKSQFDYLIEIESAAALRELRPDFARLARIPVRGVIVTARSDDPRYDFLSRFFAPAAGINEDPVTGSAHCSLAPYWAERLGKSNLSGYQVSARGGGVRVHVVGERVLLCGRAVTVLAGELRA